MFAFSLNHLSEINQEDNSYHYPVIKFKGDQVLCPMCEIWHINNSECQRND